MNKHIFRDRIGPNLPRYYSRIMMLVIICACLTVPAFAVQDLFAVARTIIIDLYTQIAGISTVLAGLMSAVAVIGAKLSNNQHKVDQAWDWLKRIWICWAIINGIGAFIAYIVSKFSGPCYPHALIPFPWQTRHSSIKYSRWTAWSFFRKYRMILYP